MFNLEHYLSELSGMDRVTLQPAAGAHGELTGILIIKAYHEHRKDFKRNKVIVRILPTVLILPQQVCVAMILLK